MTKDRAKVERRKAKGGRVNFLLPTSAFFLGCAIAAGALAQPAGPVCILVGYAPGGGTTIASDLVAKTSDTVTQ